MEFFNMLLYSIKSYSISVVDFLIDPIAWIFIFVMYTLYRRNTVLQRIMYGKKVKNSSIEIMASSILFGLLGGLFGSLIISAIGISFYESYNVLIVVLISLIFMLINQRYICFSYSGGIWTLFILLFTELVNLGVVEGQSSFSKFITQRAVFDVSSILAMVAVMHLVESLLILVDGDKGAVPIFTKRGDKVIGAFIIQRFWIVPILVFLFTPEVSSTAGVIATPDWWPLIKPAIPQNIIKDVIFLISSFVILMGYSDMVTNMDVKRKVKRSALSLSIYSLILLVISILSTKFYALKYVAAIFAPLGHEALILFELSKGKVGKYRWEFNEEGIIVLDTVPGGAAEAMGIKSGEVVIGINNKRVISLEEANDILKEYPSYLWAEVMDDSGKKRVLEYKDFVNGVRSLGIITVPKYEYGIPLIQEYDGFIKRQLYKLKGRKKKK